jgi:hypothetical protein
MEDRMTGVEVLHLVYWPGLLGFTALAILTVLASAWIDARGKGRLATGFAMALIVAFLIRLTTVTAQAFYYDQSYYCASWVGWFDWWTC